MVLSRVLLVIWRQLLSHIIRQHVFPKDTLNLDIMLLGRIYWVDVLTSFAFSNRLWHLAHRVRLRHTSYNHAPRLP